ncbi:MAG: DUF3667 domain-containing protein [Chitinophagaceae bacterium]
MSVHACKNCGLSLEGNFCASCGQSSHTEKINAAYFLHDIPHSVFHVDKGFFYTLKKMFADPGTALRDYLSGKRVMHYRPFAFVLLMSTICTLLIKGINYLVNLRFEKENPGHALEFGHGLFVKYPSLLIFIMIPLLSLITWLFFYRRPFNYWEHFLVNTYLAANLNVFLLLISLFQLMRYYISGSYGVNYVAFMCLFMAYYGHAFGSLMSTSGKLVNNIIILVFMNFFMASAYMTAFIFTGMMNGWVVK